MSGSVSDIVLLEAGLRVAEVRRLVAEVNRVLFGVDARTLPEGAHDDLLDDVRRLERHLEAINLEDPKAVQSRLGKM